MYLAWTTTGTRDDADRLAEDVIHQQLAACAQVEGPITSYFRWQGKIERTEEFRICFKCLPLALHDLEKHVLANHPYDTPEWIVIPAGRVGEKYLSWANTTSSTPPL
jgi:periplasmic divalent cation tolerance protein